jgi:hypothetical protein
MRHASSRFGLDLTSEGKIARIRFGFNAAAEHEFGIRPLLDLVAPGTPYAEDAPPPAAAMTDAISFVEMANKRGPEPLAAVVCWGAFGHLQRALDRVELFMDADKDVCTCWDKHSFAVQVRGEKTVAALKDFFDDLKSGLVSFESSSPARRVGLALVNRRHAAELTMRPPVLGGSALMPMGSPDVPAAEPAAKPGKPRRGPR